MFKKHKGCKKEVICGITCYVPPVGKGVNIVTGELEDVEILKSSTKKKDQVWFRTPLPKDWKKKREAEEERKKENPDYFDPELEEFRVQEWHRRLCGVWVMMNGKPVYITGTHYFYLNWWNIGLYPDYRDPDRKYFYFSLYCMLDPECLGFFEATKRKQGKTARAGCWQYERVSRTKFVWGGIQSKTGDDAKKNVFQKYTIYPFRKLPDFFKPLFDSTKGESPSSELRFFRPNRRGKHASLDRREELESTIDWRSSEKTSYDSQVLYSYICDEAGKLVDLDVYDLHMVVRFCCELEGEFRGKMVYTTTVEEMESGGKGALRLIKASNQNERAANGRTKSGLYTFFTPAFETLFYDKYGNANTKKAKKYYQDQREALADDPLALNAYIRKNPFTLEECFRLEQEDCLYNIMKLNDRNEVLQFMDNPTTRGNFMWKDGIRDSEVIFKPMKSGRWELSWIFEDHEQANNVTKKGNFFFPGNRTRFITGVDPFDHDKTVDNRRSNGSGITLKKHDATQMDEFSNKCFVCKYKARPKKSDLFYEDMIMQCFYFGSPMLFEDNKIGIKKYFENRGYESFFVWLPGAKKPGISGHKNNTIQIAELTEAYIEDYIEKVNYIDLIEEWINFDIDNTTKFDVAMAAGYALIGDLMVVYKKPKPPVNATHILRRKKIAAMH